MCCTFVALHCVVCYYEETFWLLKPEHGFDFEPLTRKSQLHSEQLKSLTDTLRAITQVILHVRQECDSVLITFPTSLWLLIPKAHICDNQDQIRSDQNKYTTLNLINDRALWGLKGDGCQ